MSDEIREEIRKNLIKYRKFKGLSQKELAEKLNVNSSAISIWENGYNSIDISNLFNICKILEISINDLFGKFSNDQKDTDEIREVKEMFNKLNNEGKEYIKTSLKVANNSTLYKC